MKALLLDVDGVVLKKGEYFSERFSREHNVPLEDILEFFKGPFGTCQNGEADLKEELQPYLQKWHWDKSADEFLEYWFSHDVILDPEVGENLSNLREHGLKLYLASNNEKYRAEAIENLLNNKGLLDGAYFSAHLKVRKENPEFFRRIIEDLGLEAGEISYFDNDQKNVDSAASVGIESRLYEPHLLKELAQDTGENKIKFI